ncbi:SDR family NAD(P)-dependent oxidoreductase [Bifidobacterium avesanii]|uniref:SDR family oxidoreductase n=1 Tax=Bifidobacterium avesanii TaxID=1798157 RepID=A0A7K3TJ76_9BIFI|nr:SDR family NAD(P)-dependent oxidoreductase [Bifidobacterium avesanii]KAB8288888.1 3-ketoacyl-ACP reductase [Bifidobacterium avesanii]NEG79165.1 SDR family oxidoreductase [Bifidobacterium avesanii]
MGRFDGKGVVVTGASSGMGHRIALDFAAEGATVVAVARRAERLAQLVEEARDLPGGIVAYAGDVTVAETTDGMIDKAVELAGHLDVLVNNAGIMDEFKPVAEVTDELWDKVMDVNLVGPMKAMRKAVQVMLGQENGGNIVNVASIGGIRGARAGAAYTASKHAVVGLTENTAFMYAPNHIRCNVVCPGGVNTEVMNGQTEMSQLGVGRVMAGLDTSIPSGKVEDISSAVLYIASDDAKFMTGATVVIDGGVSCN